MIIQEHSRTYQIVDPTLTRKPAAGAIVAGPKAARMKRDARVVLNTLDLPEPDAVEMATNLAKATFKWAAAGLPIVTQDAFDARTATCNACPSWQPAARFGMGKCAVCGCTRLKRWLQTEKCPLNKWPAAPLQPP